MRLADRDVDRLDLRVLGLAAERRRRDAVELAVLVGDDQPALGVDGHVDPRALRLPGHRVEQLDPEPLRRPDPGRRAAARGLGVRRGTWPSSGSSPERKPVWRVVGHRPPRQCPTPAAEATRRTAEHDSFPLRHVGAWAGNWGTGPAAPLASRFRVSTPPRMFVRPRSRMTAHSNDRTRVERSIRIRRRLRPPGTASARSRFPAAGIPHSCRRASIGSIRAARRAG